MRPKLRPLPESEPMRGYYDSNAHINYIATRHFHVLSKSLLTKKALARSSTVPKKINIFHMPFFRVLQEVEPSPLKSFDSLKLKDPRPNTGLSKTTSHQLLGTNYLKDSLDLRSSPSRPKTGSQGRLYKGLTAENSSPLLRAQDFTGVLSISQSTLEPIKTQERRVVRSKFIPRRRVKSVYGQKEERRGSRQFTKEVPVC